MNIYAEDRLVQLKPKFTAEKPKNFACPKDKRSDGSSEETEFDENLCSKQAAKKNLKYYLQNTTLHGLKYIAEDKITLPERAFFGFAFVAVIILSSYFISNIYMKWSLTPIIISTSAKETLASDVPFPAVTICNLNQASKSKVQGIAEKNLNYSLLMSLCGQNERGEWYNVRGTWGNFKTILKAVAQPCEEMLLYCSFGAKEENCSVIFNSALTDDGLCCTFNALDPSFMLRNYSEDDRISPKYSNHFVPIYWTPESGYTGDLPKNYYPRVPGGTGSRLGLTVVLNSSALEYYCTKSKSIGFKILVHNPAELPRVSNYGFLVTAGREARVPIEPIYENAVPSIRSIRKDRRRCLFSDEGDLSYYRTYSRRNCEIECEAKILIDKCDCVLYYLPRINGSARICGPNDNVCTNEVKTKIESSDKKVTCSNCWPACFELSYKAMVTATTITPGKFLTFDELPLDLFNNGTNYAEISIVNFYYLSSILRTTTKSEMFGLTDFVSSTGGILGLFMGFSVFSIIEIIYYVTLRPYCASRTMEMSRRRHHRQMNWLRTIRSRVKPGKYDGSSRFWLNDTEHKKTINNKKYRNNLNHILLHHKHNQFNNNNDGTKLYPYLE